MVQVLAPDKQPWEYLPITMSFERNMVSGESIDASKSSVIITDTSTGSDVSSDLLHDNLTVVDGNKIMVLIKGGIHGKKYKASFRAYISATKRLEEDLIF